MIAPNSTDNGPATRHASGLQIMNIYLRRRDA